MVHVNTEAQKIVELVKKFPTEEILTEEKLREYVEEGIKLNHYIGFEISGFVHLGTGLLCMQKVADFQEVGVETNIFLADYHSWINKKLGGDLSLIRRVAGGYFKEALKLSLKIVGGDPEKVNFILGSQLYERLGLEYLEDIIKVSMKMTLSRAKRSISIMGRKKGENVSFAQLLYVPMQVADLYGLKVNLAHGGIDQRKAHVIALEVWKEFGYEPVVVHHSMLPGMHISEEQRNKIFEAKRNKNREMFEEGIIEIKMSKSKPESAIFIHDSPEEIERKIKGAYCSKEIELNPVVDLLRYIIFPFLERKKETLEITNLKTKERRSYEKWEDFERDYTDSKIHPLDLKNAVSKYLIEILEPARKYFLEGPGRKYLEEMKSLTISR
jgi:tyrosyl-tRNA synthetase